MPPKKAVRLNAKQEQFTHAWVKLGNADAAAREIGYSHRSVQDLIRHKGVLELREKLITEKKYIEAKATDKAIEKLELTAEWVLKRFQEIASTGPDFRGSYDSPLSALESLAKIMRMYPEEAGYQEGARQFPDGTMEVYRAKWLKSPPPQLPAPERKDG